VIDNLLDYAGLHMVSKYLSNLSYFITFQFIGINLLFCFFVVYWLGIFNMHKKISKLGG